MRRMLMHARVALDRPGALYSDPHVKANALLQAHFSRTPLSGDLAADQGALLPDAGRLLQAIVDVVASSGWLAPALAAMEMSQCLAQGLWERDSPLLQLPHVTHELAKRAVGAGVKCVRPVGPSLPPPLPLCPFCPCCCCRPCGGCRPAAAHTRSCARPKTNTKTHLPKPL